MLRARRKAPCTYPPRRPYRALAVAHDITRRHPAQEGRQTHAAGILRTGADRQHPQAYCALGRHTATAGVLRTRAGIRHTLAGILQRTQAYCAMGGGRHTALAGILRLMAGIRRPLAGMQPRAQAYCGEGLTGSNRRHTAYRAGIRHSQAYCAQWPAYGTHCRHTAQRNDCRRTASAGILRTRDQHTARTCSTAQGTSGRHTASAGILRTGSAFGPG